MVQPTKILTQRQLLFLELAKSKFDWDTDPIQLGSQLLRVKERKDIPHLVEDFDYTKMEEYFLTYSSQLGEDVLK